MKIKAIVLIGVILLLLPTKNFTQKKVLLKIDSLKKSISLSNDNKVIEKKYEEIAMLYKNNNNDSSLTYINKSLKLLKKQSNYYGLAIRYMDKANSFIEKTNINTALKLLDTALISLRKSKKGNLNYVKGAILYTKSSAFWKNLQYDSAYYYNLESIKNIKNSKNSSSLLANYVLAYSISSDLKKNKEALHYIKEAQREAIKLNKGKETLAIIYNNLSLAYGELNKLDSSEYYLKKAIETSDNNREQTIAYLNLGSLLEQKGEEKKAMDLYKDIRFRSQRSGFTEVEGYALANIGKIYCNWSDYNKANKYIDSSIHLIEGLDCKSLLKENYYSKIIIFSAINKDSVEFYLSLYDTYKDSVYDTEVAKSYQNLNIKYQTGVKELEITHLMLENSNNKMVRIKERNYYLYIILIFVIICCFVSFLLYYSRIKKKKVQDRLKIESLEKKELELLLQIKESDLSEKINLLFEKNKIIDDLKESVNRKGFQVSNIIAIFEQNYISEIEWNNIRLQFDLLYPNFINNINLKNSSLTKNDIKLIILLKLKYSNGAMSDILAISYEGVRKAKLRLSKKIDFSLLS